MYAHKLTTRLSAVLAALALLGALVLPPTSRAAGKLQIITATTDLAALAQEVGGDKIEVESIARGYQDPHFVDAKPSFLLKLKRADLLIVVGLELEIGWLPPLITQSTNPKIQVGAPGYFDASRFAKILEIPTGVVTRAEGDVGLTRRTDYASQKASPTSSARCVPTTPRISGSATPISSSASSKRTRNGSPT